MGTTQVLWRNRRRHLTMEWQYVLVLSGPSGRLHICVNSRGSSGLWLYFWCLVLMGGLRPCIFHAPISFVDHKVPKGEEHFSSFLCPPHLFCWRLWSPQEPGLWCCWANWRAHPGQTATHSLQIQVICRNVNLPAQAISPGAWVSQLLWPFSLELSLPALLPRRIIHSIVSACSPDIPL